MKKAVRKEEHQNTYRTNVGANSPHYGSGAGRTKKIFVGGLPSSVTEEDFRSYFGQFGTITDVVVMYDHTTQRPRGFGFITYELEEGVENAMQKKFHELHEKTVEVKRAVPKELSGGGRSGGSGGFGGSRGSAYGGYSMSSPVQHAYGGAGPPYGGARGGFSPYGPLYGTPAYGYGMALNGGGYGGGSYGGGPGYPAPGGYALGYMAPSPGYGGASSGARSPWLGHSGGSSTTYGSNPATYGASLNNAYGSAPWTPGQSPSNANVGYNNGSYGYGGTNVPGGVYGFGDAYVSYGDSSSPHAAAPSPPSGSGAVPDSGYSVSGRQITRGPDARFRPYPSTGERVA